MCIYIYVYVYIYMYRERERERDVLSKPLNQIVSAHLQRHGRIISMLNRKMLSPTKSYQCLIGLVYIIVLSRTCIISMLNRTCLIGISIARLNHIKPDVLSKPLNHINA